MKSVAGVMLLWVALLCSCSGVSTTRTSISATVLSCNSTILNQKAPNAKGFVGSNSVLCKTKAGSKCKSSCNSRSVGNGYNATCVVKNATASWKITGRCKVATCGAPTANLAPNSIGWPDSGSQACRTTIGAKCKAPCALNATGLGYNGTCVLTQGVAKWIVTGTCTVTPKPSTSLGLLVDNTRVPTIDQATNDSIPAMLTFTIDIGYMKGGVNVVQLMKCTNDTKGGFVIGALISNMSNDGDWELHGDEEANDSIWSYKVAANSREYTTPGVYCYTALVHDNAEAQNTNAVYVQVFVPPQAAIITESNKFHEKMHNRYMDLIIQGRSVADSLAEIHSDLSATAAQYKIDRIIVGDAYLVYMTSFNMAYMIADPRSFSKTSTSNSSGFVSTTTDASGLSGMVRPLAVSSQHPHAVHASSTAVVKPGLPCKSKGPARVISPHYSNGNAWSEETDEVVKLLEENGYDINTCYDAGCTLEDFKGWGHIWMKNPWWSMDAVRLEWVFWPAETAVFVSSHGWDGIVSSNQRYNTRYSGDFMCCRERPRLVMLGQTDCSVAKDPAGCVIKPAVMGILPPFVEAYAGGNLHGGIIHFSACRSHKSGLAGKFADTFFRLGASGFAAYGETVPSNRAAKDSQELWKGLVEQRQTLSELQGLFGMLVVDYDRHAKDARLLRPLCPPMKASAVQIQYWSMKQGGNGGLPVGAARLNDGPKWGSGIYNDLYPCDTDLATPPEFGLMRYGAANTPMYGIREWSFDIHAAYVAGKCSETCTIETFIAYEQHQIVDPIFTPPPLPMGAVVTIFNKTDAQFTGVGDSSGFDAYDMIPKDYLSSQVPMGPLPMTEENTCPSTRACVVTITHEGADTPTDPGADKVIGVAMDCN